MTNILKIRNLLFALILSITAFSCNLFSGNPSERELEEQRKLVAKGKYLVDIMGCNDCHSPKVRTAGGVISNPSKLLSGFPQGSEIGPFDTLLFDNWILFNHHNTAIAGPWGVSFSANITSDETGIGNWTLEQFGKALKEGKYKGLDDGRKLLPPMPWQNYTNLADDDLKAIFAYLKSTPPIQNVVPDPIPPVSEGN